MKISLKQPTARGFTLMELLVVIAILGIIIAVSLPALRGQNDAGNFSKSVEGIAGILDQARAYATAQNTYVWVAFYPLDPSALPAPYTDHGGEQLYVVTYASNDGTDPVQWGAALSDIPIPYIPTGSPAEIVQLAKVRLFKQIHLVAETGSYFTSAQIPSLPATQNEPALPLSQVNFQLPLKSPALTLSDQPLPADESSKTLVVGFTPLGSAQVGPSPVAYIELDFQPMQAANVLSTNNLAALRISGLGGLPTIYRK